jgi:uncharacterized protein YaiI (UPF0178 family)
MKIYIDADACPRAIKDILFRASARAHVALILVANQWMPVPVQHGAGAPLVTIIQVPHGSDMADVKIVELCEPGDLVVTADIPLAADVVKKGGFALNPRGELYDANNIGGILSMRDFMDSLRGSGIETGGPAAFSASDRANFANALDRFLARAR